MQARLLPSLICVVIAAGHAAAEPAATDPDSRAANVVKALTPTERNSLVHGAMAISFGNFKAPPEAIPGAGYVPGIPRLGIPALAETDASLGVAYVMGLRKDGATALPSGMALASTWNPALLQQGGAMIGGEARAKGFNVLLAGGVNLIREPRNGRTFEYLSEDPWLAGTLAGASIAGIQSVHVISTVKHFAFNDEETGRHFYDVHIAEAPGRESDLLAFRIAVERGRPGSVMCAYNRINAEPACASEVLLNHVLKQEWGYPGWVMSDWGAVGATDAALHGLDQESGEQIDASVYFGKPLEDAAAADPRYAARVADMDHRILRSMFAVGVDAYPAKPAPIDFKADAAVAETAALQGIVLLKNRDHALPLEAGSERIAVIGGYADSGVLSGGGSSQVQGEGGPAISRPNGAGVFAALTADNYQRSVPLDALRARAPQADIVFRNGRYLTDAVIAAKSAAVAIVFATQPLTEGLDAPDLSLPDGQDALIAAVAAANPHTIVVLETGGPVLMPWLDQVAGVLEAWYPGAHGAQALAALVFGDQNPSGRLPVSFPASTAQLPRPLLPGALSVEPDFAGGGKPGQALDIDYNVEGADIGYRWYARTSQTPLFPFGFGLSYTTFETAGLKLTRAAVPIAAATVHNTGPRAGADVVQLYVTSLAGTAAQRLVAYERVELAPGASQTLELTVDPRLLAHWDHGAWRIKGGTYRFALGRSAADLEAPVDLVLPAKVWKDPTIAAM
jgi:beta-glucosidase